MSDAGSGLMQCVSGADVVGIVLVVLIVFSLSMMAAFAIGRDP